MSVCNTLPVWLHRAIFPEGFVFSGHAAVCLKNKNSQHINRVSILFKSISRYWTKLVHVHSQHTSQAHFYICLMLKIREVLSFLSYRFLFISRSICLIEASDFHLFTLITSHYVGQLWIYKSNTKYDMSITIVILSLCNTEIHIKCGMF